MAGTGMGAIQHSGFRGGRGRLGDLLRAKGLVSEQQIAEAIACAHKRGTRLGTALVELGHADVDQISDALARQHGVVACRDDDLRVIATPVAAIVPAGVARKHCVVPVRIIGGHTLLVAMRDPGNEDAITELWRRTGLSIRPVVAAEDALTHAIDHLYGPASDTPPPPPVPETPPPRASVRPRSASYSPPTPRPPAPRERSLRWPLVTLGVAALGLGAVVVGGEDSVATEAAPSTLDSERLALRADIGPGWRRIRDRSAPVQRLGGEVASELLVRGDAAAPDEVLALARAPFAATLEQWTVDIVERGLPLRRWWSCDAAVATGCVVGLHCAPNADVHPDGALCAGEALHDGVGYPVTAWLWPAGDGMAMLVWAPRSSRPVPPDDALVIARSIQLR